MLTSVSQAVLPSWLLLSSRAILSTGHVRVSLVSLPAGPNSKAKNHGPYVLKEPLLVTEHRTGKRVKVQVRLNTLDCILAH